MCVLTLRNTAQKIPSSQRWSLLNHWAKFSVPAVQHGVAQQSKWFTLVVLVSWYSWQNLKAKLQKAMIEFLDFPQPASILYTALNILIFQVPSEHSTELSTFNGFSSPKVPNSFHRQVCHTVIPTSAINCYKASQKGMRFLKPSLYPCWDFVYFDLALVVTFLWL